MRLLITPAEGDPFERDVQDGSIIVGRSSSAHLVLADLYASRHHARLTQRGESLQVEDLGSRNGTFVNGRRVGSMAEVGPGDVIRIAGSAIRRVEQGASITEQLTRTVTTGSAVGQTVIRASNDEPDDSSDSLARIRGEEALSAYAWRLRTLREIHRGLSRAASRADLLRSILDWGLDLAGADQAVIYLRAADGELRRADALPSSAPGIPLPEEMVSEALQQKVAVARARESAHEIGASALPAASYVIAAPLLDADDAFGVLVLDSPVPVTEERLDLVLELAGEAALEIKKVGLVEEAAQRRLLEHELALARRIQLGILHGEVPSFEGYSFLTRNLPSRGVSGDFHALTLRAGGEQCVVFMGDVSGKGFAAALLTASVEALSAVMIEDGAPPDQICTKLSRQLFERTLPSAFATAFVASLDRASGRLVYTNAGDNPALLVRPDGSLMKLESLGLPLALMKESRYQSRAVEMEPGATLLLYTDGIIEAANREDEQYGLARLEACFLGMRRASLGEIFTAIQSDLDVFVGDVPYTDDRTIVLVRRSGV